MSCTLTTFDKFSTANRAIKQPLSTHLVRAASSLLVPRVVSANVLVVVPRVFG